MRSMTSSDRLRTHERDVPQEGHATCKAYTRSGGDYTDSAFVVSAYTAVLTDTSQQQAAVQAHACSAPPLQAAQMS